MSGSQSRLNATQILRIIWLVISIVLTSFATAQTASDRVPLTLILIRTATMGPKVDPKIDVHHETVLWPPYLTDNGSNRLLSLTTGLDWAGDSYDLSFRSDHFVNAFRANNFRELLKTGYFEARKTWLAGQPIVAISRPTGTAIVNPDELLVALDESDAVKPIPYKEARLSGSLAVFEAESWSEQSDIITRVGGRVLTVELVPEGNRTWGAFYTHGTGWPDGIPIDPSTGVAGLVRARNLISLLRNPSSFQWTGQPGSHEVPAMWFEFVRTVGAGSLAALALMIGVVVASAAYSLQTEAKAPLASLLLNASALAPAALLLMGNLGRAYGLDQWIAWLMISAAILGLGYLAMVSLLKVLFPGTHSLLAAGVAGLSVCALSHPNYSPYSALFGLFSATYSSEALALSVVYLAVIVAFSKGSTQAALWLGRLAPIGWGVGGFLGHQWWMGDGGLTFFLVLIIPMLAAEGWLRWPVLLALALAPGPDGDVFRHGFTWAPGSCYPSLSASHSVNLATYFQFLTSPGFLTFGVIVGYLVSFSDRFLLRQLKHLLYREPRLKAVLITALGILAMGIFSPSLLPAGLIVAYGGMITLFATAISPN